ncbi:hypothetical protein [Kitasatospora sp. NPDC005856]|uniref:hypothetical protein n=1 Tax=Kitasatospora sp. NPDC005856 TaxID=3154566 RepID=UPI003403FC6A
MTIHPLPGRGVRPPAPGRAPRHREPRHQEPRHQGPFPSGFGPLPAPVPVDHDASIEATA